MRSWTQNFSSWASRPKADHDASRGSPSGLPGGLCASSVIILPLDPHLVDASVNFEDLGDLQLLRSNFGGCQVNFEDLGYLQSFKFTFARCNS